MKKFITSAAILLPVSFNLPACKKSDKQPTTIEKIHAKWNLVADIFNNHVSSQDSISTTAGALGNIIDFKMDGKVNSTIQGGADTANYVLSGNTKIVINKTITYDITMLTSNLFFMIS